MVNRRLPPWALPLAALLAISLAVSAAISLLTGGREIADDAANLLELAQRPLVLFESYETSGLGPHWGSQPPLLPLLWGVLVAPWSLVFSDFWAIRLGALSWTGVMLLVVYAVLTRLEAVPEPRVRRALWLYALLPSVWGATTVLPQEEIYVGGGVLLCYAAAATRRWRSLPPLLLLLGFAGKYFALVALLPLAFASPRPWRNAVAWLALVASALAAYLGYHWLAHGAVPLSNYRIDPSGSISIWALLWQLGIQPETRVVSLLGVLLAGGIGLALSWQARRDRVPLPYAVASVFYAALLSVSQTFPGYVLWVVPLALVCFARMREALHRRLLVVGMLGWSVAEWGQNLARGIELELQGTHGEGKAAVAELATRLLGAGFPYHALHVLCLVAVLASGALLIAVLWSAGKAEASTSPT